MAIWCLVHVLVRAPQLRRAAVTGLLALGAAAALTAVIMVTAFGSLGAQAEASGEITHSTSQAVGAAIDQLVTFNINTDYPQWTLALLLVVGIAIAARMLALVSTLWAAVAFGTLYCWSAAYDTSFTHAITALWWGNPTRLAGLFAVPAVLLAALGLTAVVDGLVRTVQRVRQPWPVTYSPRVRAAALGVTVLVFVLLTDFLYTPTHVRIMRTTYTDGPMLSQAERTGLAQVADRIHGAGTILNDPYDGSSWGYSLQGLPMLFQTPVYYPQLRSGWGNDRAIMLESFNHIDTSPMVQDAAARLDVRWVIIDRGLVYPDQLRQQGLTDLWDVDALTLVYDNGAVQLYRLDRPDTVNQP